MEARFNVYGNTVAATFAKYVDSAGKVVSESTLPAATQGGAYRRRNAGR